MNEVQVSEAQKPDSGLADAQAELARLHWKRGWIDCLDWLRDSGTISDGVALAGLKVKDEVLRESGR